LTLAQIGTFYLPGINAKVLENQAEVVGKRKEMLMSRFLPTLGYTSVDSNKKTTNRICSKLTRKLDECQNCMFSIEEKVQLKSQQEFNHGFGGRLLLDIGFIRQTFLG
jgi:hypothetical protein